MANKKDQQKIAQVIADGAAALRKVASERDSLVAVNKKLAEENKALRTRMEAEKLASTMLEKGMTSAPYGELVSDLEKRAHEDPRRFETMKEAVSLSGTDMLKSASIGSREQRSSRTVDDFTRFILSNVD